MSDGKKMASESTDYSVRFDESMQVDDVAHAVSGHARESHEALRVQDRISKEAKITVAEIMRKWVMVFFCMIVVVSVSSTYAPFPVNIVIGIVGGMCGIVVTDHYRTIRITRETVKIE